MTEGRPSVADFAAPPPHLGNGEEKFVKTKSPFRVSAKGAKGT